MTRRERLACVWIAGLALLNGLALLASIQQGDALLAGANGLCVGVWTMAMLTRWART